MQYCKKRINVLYDQVYEKEENNNIMIRIMILYWNPVTARAENTSCILKQQRR